MGRDNSGRHTYPLGREGRTTRGVIFADGPGRVQETGASHVSRKFCKASRETESLGGLSCFSFDDVFGLRPFLALNYFELNVIAFLQAFVAFGLNGAVVDEHIGAIFPANKAEALRVVKPFHFTFNSRHDPYSEPSR